MTVMLNEGNSHAVAIDDQQHEHELSEQPQETSPTPRSAAYPSEIDLGRSQAFVEMMKQVDSVSNTNSAVLLTGEAGAGKELVAAAIHHRSGRSDWPFVMINCAAIPAELVEPKLFGPDQDRGGLLEEIDGGTVFLDELTQTSLLFNRGFFMSCKRVKSGAPARAKHKE